MLKNGIKNMPENEKEIEKPDEMVLKRFLTLRT